MRHAFSSAKGWTFSMIAKSLGLMCLFLPEGWICLNQAWALLGYFLNYHNTKINNSIHTLYNCSSQARLMIVLNKVVLGCYLVSFFFALFYFFPCVSFFLFLLLFTLLSQHQNKQQHTYIVRLFMSHWQMRLVHLKTGCFGEKNSTSYMVLFPITRTPKDQLWSSLVCAILKVVHTFNLRHERASGSKYLQSSDRLNHIICKPAVVLVFKWTSLRWSFK